MRGLQSLRELIEWKKERFLPYVAAVPRERDEMQNRAATSVGMTGLWLGARGAFALHY